MATGQHLTDLAAELAGRGHDVTVIAGDHGYDDPARKFPSREDYRGVKIRRIAYSSFGKKSKWARAADFASFHLGLFLRLAVTPSQDVVVGLTSPPLVAAVGAAFCRLKGGRFVYWVMDMNPEEAIAAGWLDARSPAARFLTAVSRGSFRRSARVVALDRFMKARIESNYGVPAEKITVLPPWAHDDRLEPVPHEKNAFRREHVPAGKFVVMYSGNHSPCHPLDTLLEAARELRSEDVLFYFIGGGSLVATVRRFREENGLDNIRQMGYQPLERLAESLSAADLHVTVMGKPFVGILHPCKVYGILAVGRPFVFIGPRESHMGDLSAETGLGTQVEHGDVA
ncbi:MAG TPA: glycosyltransferase family 4 protein, partial [Candidatus Eisenbacteria bacterium]|nr:glycosyltransferase family 4 protein [Candidatus Eisenbacteria bacterium]